jgi:hypothetical protein
MLKNLTTDHKNRDFSLLIKKNQDFTQGKRMKLLFSPYDTFVFYFFQSGTYFHYNRHPFVKK